MTYLVIVASLVVVGLVSAGALYTRWQIQTAEARELEALLARNRAALEAGRRRAS